MDKNETTGTITAYAWRCIEKASKAPADTMVGEIHVSQKSTRLLFNIAGQSIVEESGDEVTVALCPIGFSAVVGYNRMTVNPSAILSRNNGVSRYSKQKIPVKIWKSPQ